MYCFNGSAFFEQCRFEHNHANEFGGAFYGSITNTALAYCILEGNTAAFGGGAVNMVGSEITLTHCTLVSNSAPIGAGIRNDHSTASLDHSILYGSLDGAGLLGTSGSFSSIHYCDACANEGGDFEGEGIHPAVGVILMTNANGDSCDLYHNILLDPRFEGEPPGFPEYALSANSPCIDAGDPEMEHDPDGSITDIGAVVYDHSVQVETLAKTVPGHEFVNVFPNPFNSTASLVFHNPAPSRYSIFIFNTLGQLVDEIDPGFYHIGWHHCTIDANALASGTYYLVVDSNESRIVRRVVVTR